MGDDSYGVRSSNVIGKVDSYPHGCQLTLDGGVNPYVGFSHTCPICAFASSRDVFVYPKELEEAALTVHGGTHSWSECEKVVAAIDDFAAAAAKGYAEFQAALAERRDRVLLWRSNAMDDEPL